MLYYIVKPIIRVALFFFCRKIYWNTKQYWSAKGPLLLAVNHPNSFLDAIIIGTYSKKPVYFLARGDAFKNKWALKILTALKCKPVYRLREGKEYLHLNDATFEACKEIFQQNGIVLIFSEGLCENEWAIRPLKKGTARLAFGYWKHYGHINHLKVLPIGINYHSFRKVPKKVWVNYGTYIDAADFNLNETEGANFLLLNQKIKQQWDHLCFHSNNANDFEHKLKIENYLNTTEATCEEIITNVYQNNLSTKLSKKRKTKYFSYVLYLFHFLSCIPAILFFGPFYFLLTKMVHSIAGKSVHYDSILFAVLTLFYLFFFLVLVLLSIFIFQNLYYPLLLGLILFISLCFLTKIKLF